MKNSSTKKTTRLNPKLRKAEILTMARKVLSDVGHENFMPTDVAKRCKVSSGTIYRYFPTRHDLLVAVAKDWLEEIIKFDTGNIQQGDIFKRLHAIISYNLDLIKREPTIARFMFMVVRMDATYRDTGLYKRIARFSSMTTDIIEDAVRLGIFRDNIPISIARDIVFGCIEHQSIGFLRDESEFPNDKLAQHIAEAIYYALAASPPVKTEMVSEVISHANKAINSLNEDLVAIQDIIGVKRI